ncbi:MAG: TIGR01777 family oxidoreductase [Verrucomicrobiaceae bacterium]|nr:TIGR01777 family oxidoreductase [Verrucomicrobiaceae bacterium]
MKIGITGATGLIGNAVGRLAAESGHSLIAYSRDPKRSSLPWAAETRAVDVRADQPLDLSGLDTIIHLAGETILGFWTKAKMQRIRDTRVDLTRKIARTITSMPQPPKALLCASGTGFYGDRGDELLDESASAGSDYLASVCIDWEAAAREAEQVRCRVVHLRTGLVFAREGGAWPLMKKAFSLGAGGNLGDGKQWMPWIHLEDEARLILWAAEHEMIRGPVNLAAPEALRNADFTRALAKHLKRPAFMHAPRFALKLALRELADALTASQHATPAKALAGGFQFRHPDLKTALTAL